MKYRTNNTTSTETDFKNALRKLTEILINNKYPEDLIKLNKLNKSNWTNQIEQIKNRNFLPNKKIVKE